MGQITIRMKPDLERKLKELAVANNTTLADYCRSILSAHADGIGKPQETASSTSVDMTEDMEEIKHALNAVVDAVNANTKNVSNLGKVAAKMQDFSEQVNGNSERIDELTKAVNEFLGKG